MFIAASSDEVNCLTSEKDLMSELVGQEGRDHNVVDLVLLSPKLVVSSQRIYLNEELAERVVYLAFYHPLLYH